ALRLCSARNVFADLRDLGPVVDIEAVIARNPDIIVAVAPPGEGAAWLAEWKRFGSLSAVRGGRLIAFEDQAFVRLGPSVIDAVLEHDLLLRRGQRRLRLLHIEAREIDAALGEAQLEDFQHLLELEIHLRAQRDAQFLELEARTGVLEVEALRQLTVGLIDGIRHFVRIELGHDIERGHDSDPKRRANQLIVPQLTARHHRDGAQAGWW